MGPAGFEPATSSNLISDRQGDVIAAKLRALKNVLNLNIY